MQLSGSCLHHLQGPHLTLNVTTRHGVPGLLAAGKWMYGSKLSIFKNDGLFLFYNIGLFSEISFANADRTFPQEGELQLTAC